MIILICIVGAIALLFLGWYIVVKLTLAYDDKNKKKLLEKHGYHKDESDRYVNDKTGDVYTAFDIMFEEDLIEYLKEKESQQNQHKSKKRK